MRLAVGQGLSDQDVPTEEAARLRHFVNKEARPVLKQARRSLNALNAEPAGPVSSDGAGTFTTIWTSDAMPQDGLWVVQATVLGIGATQRAAYQLVRGIYSTAGTLGSLSSASMPYGAETAAACDARINTDASARTVYIEARDDAAEVMDWSAVVQTFEVVRE